MGRLLALALARQGHQVQVFDAHSPQGEDAAAPVAAAMLAPLAESAITEPPVVRMGQYGLERWPQLLAELPQPVFYQRQGTLIVWHRQDAADAQRLAALLEKNCRLNPSLPRPQPLQAGDFAQAEPALQGRFQAGLLLPDEGQLDNRQLLPALLLALEQAGVALHWHSPQDPQALMAAHPNDWVLDCRGLGARSHWPALRGVRGEVIRVRAPEVTLQRPTRLIHPRYSLYIAPKPEQVFVIGATEIESDDKSPASVRSTMELLSALYTVHSGFAEARILELNTQCRPTLPDNLPALRWLGPRALQVNGLYRHGYMIAPAMLDTALQVLALGQGANSPLAQQWEVKVEAAGQV